MDRLRRTMAIFNGSPMLALAIGVVLVGARPR